MTETEAGVTGMSDDQRARFERDGYLVIPNVLTGQEVDFYTAALDRVYAAHGGSGPMHRLAAVTSCSAMIGLIDHPSMFGLVWSVLGWNIHVYHSHLDVHPRIQVPKPYRFEWHQDGGRQNRELETSPRPRLSVKVAYWLSDLSEPGRGNFKVVPGSHRADRIDGPPRRDIQWPEPVGAIEVCADPGDAVFFDRRLWHTRTDNHSPITRKGVFFAYSHRWSYRRDNNAALFDSHVFAAFSPVQQQLLGAPLATGDQLVGDHQWGHYPKSTPLYAYLAERDLLDPSNPPLIP